MVEVSVVIPVYNAEKYVAETIQSVLDQTYQDFEILIIDDGSPDQSVEVCRQFTDPRIKIIHQLNRGLAGARNTGIHHAQGRYLAFLDADDLWKPEKLEKHVEHLDHSPLVGVSFSYSELIDATGTKTGLTQQPRRLQGITPAYALCRNPIGNGSAAVFRRELFEAICFPDDVHGVLEDCYFDERFRQAEDLECWVRITIQTQWQLVGIPEYLTLYRIHSTGLSANALNHQEGMEQVIEKIRSYAPEVVAACEHTARAYHLRYTARRAVSLQNSPLAVEMINRALIADWKILVVEPQRTIVTLLAAYLLWLLPQPIYGWMERFALKTLQLKHKSQALKTT